MGNRQWFVLYVLVCLEVGFFLTLVPWSAVWERNYFLEAFPDLRPLLLSPTLRGAVCGLGLANIYVGVTEILNRLRTASENRAATDPDAEPSGNGRSKANERERAGAELAAQEDR